MSDYYLKFEFSSIHNTSKNMNYCVYAENKDDLKLFMTQHGFSNVPNESVTLVEKGKHEGDHVLEPYKFRSNSSNELFTVMTCWKFVEDAIAKLSRDLSETMLFGEAIVRRDIEIFKVIGDVINGLDQGRIIDFLLCDYTPSENDFGDERIKNSIELYQLQKEYMRHIDHPSEDNPEMLIYSDLCDAMVDEDGDPDKGVLPITIECYINNFTEMMMDAFV